MALLFKFHLSLSLSFSPSLFSNHPWLRRRRRRLRGRGRRGRRRRRRRRTPSSSSSSFSPPPPRPGGPSPPSSPSVVLTAASSRSFPLHPKQHGFPQRALRRLGPPFQLLPLGLPRRLPLSALPRVAQPARRDGEGAPGEQGAGEPAAVAREVGGGAGAERRRGGGGLRGARGRGRRSSGGGGRGSGRFDDARAAFSSALERVDPRDGGVELFRECREAGVLGGGRRGHLERERGAGRRSVFRSSLFDCE